MAKKSLFGFISLFASLALLLLLALSCGSGSGDDDDSGESPTNDDDDSAEDDDDDSQADDDYDDDDDTSDDDDNDDDDESDDDDDSSDDDDDDTHQPLQCSGGMCLDPESGLTWIQAPAVLGMVWQDAKDYCQTLDFGGYDNWKLPSISELRTLIRGCHNTETGGACQYSDSCTQEMTCWSEECDGCGNGQGPCDGGSYLDDGIDWTHDGNMDAFWTMTEAEPLDPQPEIDYAFSVQFYNAGVWIVNQAGAFPNTICVRY